MTDWDQLAKKILERVLLEWRRQGHDLTSKVEDTATTTVEEVIGFIRITGNLEFYSKFVNSGVTAANIPYTAPSGRGGKSKYIEGLIKYAKARGMENPKSAAFAIAAKHKKEGMSTKGSRSYSSTGQRQNFLEVAFADILSTLDDSIIEISAIELETEIDKVIFKENETIIINI